MESAGLISQALFLWVQPMMLKGFRVPLGAEDSLLLPSRLKPCTLRARFEVLWARELASQAAASAKGPSPGRALRHLVSTDLCLAVAFQAVAVFSKFACVLLLRRLVQITTKSAEDERVEGFAIAASLFLCSLLEGSFAAFATLRMQLALYGVLATVAQVVLWKGATLHPDSKSFGRGDLVTLAISDFARLIDMSGVLMQGLGAPLMLVVAFVMLLLLLGPMVLVDIVTVVTIGFVISRVSKVQGSSFRNKMIWQGRRVAVLNEMLQSVRFTKYYVLEDHYEAKMLNHRRDEEKQLFMMKVALALTWPVAAFVPTATTVVILSLHIALKGELPPTEDVFAVLAIARFLYAPFAFFGNGLGGWNMLQSAISRLRSLLLLPDVKRQPLLEDSASETGLSIADQSFSWSLREDVLPTLASIKLEVPKGELWAVVGELGSGKSSLLAAFLGDLGVVGDKPCSAHAHGPTRSYVAQEPMVMNATVKKNILFGGPGSLDDGQPQTAEEMDAAYRRAVAAAALEPDLEMLPDGDQTEIGEKGITLSGGQKARVALARAVFASKPGGVVLLDDPLAAVDAHVGKHLFEKCIVEALAGTTRLLVTNQLHFLRHRAVKQIVVMSKGRIAEQGNFQELEKRAHGLFAKMASSIGGTGQQTKHREDVPIEKRSASLIPDAKEERDHTKLVKVETKAEGAVTGATFIFFLRALGGVWVFAVLLLCAWMFHLGEVVPDVVLLLWVNDPFSRPQSFYLALWSSVSILATLLLVASRFSWAFATMQAAKRVHVGLLRRVLHCPTSFFDRTPSGRIMNRLGEDQMLVDFTAGLNLEVLCICSWQVFDQIVLTVAARPWVAPFIAVFFACFLVVRGVHRRAARETIRWWMVTKSPLFNAFEEVLTGTTTIFAFDRERHFRTRFETALEKNLAWLFSRDASNLWTEQRLTFLAALVAGTLAVQMVVSPGISGTVSLGSLSLVYALLLGFSLKSASFMAVQVEGVFASVERVMEFTENLEQEPAWKMPADLALAKEAWPSKDCTLEFQEVSVRYLPHMPRALDCVSFRLEMQEKVGIVGRTGSGKSTVMGAIFRLFELEQGRILLGGVDISGLGMGFLRRQITIVPQDPILFSGELRKNLDPLSARRDDEIWQALHRCHLGELVQGLEGGLAGSVAEGGSNFSVGERQVLCLARALLRGGHVLCLDEATANVDPTNDQRIQHVLAKEVQHLMVLTIAHRLHTVLKANRILVLDAGRVAQLDTPQALLNQAGIFKELAATAGVTSSRIRVGTNCFSAFRGGPTESLHGGNH